MGGPSRRHWIRHRHAYRRRAHGRPAGIRAGTDDVKVGSKSGNTNELATISGALTPGNTLITDANGNLIDGGAPPTDGADGAPGAPGSPGSPGADGTAATIAVGTVTTVDPGDPATVTNSGSSSAAVFDFEIPLGPAVLHGFGADFNGGGAAFSAGLTAYVTVPVGA